MIISSWNIRGHNDPLKQQELSRFLLLNKIDCYAVVETKIKAQKVKSITAKFKGFSVVTNNDTHTQGRILVLWMLAALSLTVVFSSAQILHCTVTGLFQPFSFDVYFVYGLHSVRQREELWTNLLRVAPPGRSWICMGDFNVVLSRDERTGDHGSNTRDMTDFQAFDTTAGLSDMPYTGAFFTWTIMQDESHRKWSKLDRIMGNQEWYLLRPAIAIAFLPPGLSDHSPIVAKLGGSPFPQKQFRFLNSWCAAPSYATIV
ncbi:hypothetical protein vseg_001957 [Gypsophila vaccaria]